MCRTRSLAAAPHTTSSTPSWMRRSKNRRNWDRKPIFAAWLLRGSTATMPMMSTTVSALTRWNAQRQPNALATHADRHTHHGGDGEAGEHPCDEFRAEGVGGHIGRVGHGDGHQCAGHQRDQDASGHQHRVVGREGAQQVARQEHADQRHMRGEPREARGQGRTERRDRRVHEREQGHQIAVTVTSDTFNPDGDVRQGCLP